MPTRPNAATGGDIMIPASSIDKPDPWNYLDPRSQRSMHETTGNFFRAMLVKALLDTARNQPDQVAIQDATRTLTFSRLTVLARVMRDFVLCETSRDRVGIMLPGGGAFAATCLGTLWASKIAVPLNFLLGAEELEDIIRDADIDLVLTIHHFDKTTAEFPVRTVCVEDLPLKRWAMVARFRSTPPPPGNDPDALSVLLYTSGTSGACKGVELSTRNLHSNCEAIIEAVGLCDDDRFLSVLPPFHVFGLTVNTLVPIVRGLATHVIPRFSPAAVLRAITKTKPTILMAIPSMYGALLRAKSTSGDAFRGFRLVVSGGEPLPDAIARGFRERFGVELLEGYGLTETSPVLSLNAPKCHKRGTVGRPLKNVEVRIIGADSAEMPIGDEGEITVRGPNVMLGYHNRPSETAAVLNADGWFATGDLGTIDADGFLRITGRKKDLIIVGGENVHPGEIESVLEQHPAVEEAAVIGMPDASRGEAPLAFVTFKADHSATEIEMRSFAKQRLAGFKVPKEIRVVEDFPRGPTGKVLKRILRKSFAAGQVSA